MENIDKKIVVTASVLAAVTIALGAFGAHGLKELIDTKALETFETGVRYQMYHVLALLIVGFANGIPMTTKKWVFRFFGFGILLFSGSLYFLALQDVLSFSMTFLGPVTPIGGLLFILGWLRLVYGLLTIK
ncbi:uncharacterized membrane protein YgdD (TMEM256/DUF423 family) [Ulvibacter sp. MAR_2010_11]|uniref:DUF423 domain-containing protein n=1 Tax=Ulvibacter sp. MAR_2010_11 TaxID=1250229 RepID=UPI000C2B7126|nr:DUF423 domain-containing protein [Ulvibacter sp. MAR_2010_11]PKA82670.1 uncharacterized membrane protein YgdD (TMEM256/DUF423 family) [Ulvibacter sp. MAR_2010_11]